MESETKILLSIESLFIFHSTSKKELAQKKDSMMLPCWWGLISNDYGILQALKIR